MSEFKIMQWKFHLNIAQVGVKIQVLYTIFIFLREPRNFDKAKVAIDFMGALIKNITLR